jgi:small subunit ribosomal protein S2
MTMTRLSRLKKRYEGIKEMKKSPDGIFVIDGHYELQAIKEANVLGITVFAILGTTGQPKLCDHFVPANVNNLKSLLFVTEELAPSMKRTVRETVAEKIAKKPHEKAEEQKAESKEEVV